MTSVRYLFFFYFVCTTIIAVGQDGIHFSKKEQIITVDPVNNSFSEKGFYSGICTAKTKNKARIYFGELQKLNKVKARYALLGQDKWKKVSKKDFVTSSVLTSSFYAGIQKTTILFPKMDSPYRFRYSYEMENQDILFLSSLDFMDAQHVDTFNYEIILPVNYELHFQIEDSLKAYNIVQFEKVENKSQVIYRFTAVPDKGDKLPGNDYSRVRLIVVPKGIKPYDFFNDWYNELVKPNTLLTGNVKAAVAKEVADITDDRERIAAIFKLIKERTSYIAIENGIGAVMPRDVNKIWTAQQGDCKDMSNLLCQSLRSIGYDAQLALSATIGHSFDLDFPALSSANHVICVLNFEGEWLYMDATEREGFFGYPSQQIQGKHIFIVNDEAGELHLVPEIKASENRVEHQLFLKKSERALTGTVQYDYHGMSQIALRSATKQIGNSRLEERLEPYLERQANNLNYENVTLYLQNDKCTIKGDINSERNFTNIRKKTYLSLAFLPSPHDQEVDAKDTEVHFYRTEDQQFTIRLKLDKAIRLQDFEPVSEKAEGISFDFSVNQKESDEVEIKYRYVNELLLLNNEKIAAFHKINKLIKETLRKSIIYEDPT